MIKWLLLPYLGKHSLEVECGQSKLFPWTIGINSRFEFSKKFGHINLALGNIQKFFAPKSLDSIVIKCTRKTDLVKEVLKNCIGLVKNGGHLILCFPGAENFPIASIAREVGNLSIRLIESVSENGSDVLCVALKISNDDVEWYKQKDGKKSVLILRQGVFGDALQVGSILPHLRDQGYNWITWIGSPLSKLVLDNNPYIDEYLAYDIGQLDRSELVKFWDFQRGRKAFDKVLNMNYIVEATLMASAVSPQRFWPKDVRSRLMGKPYMELIHDVAEVPHVYTSAFFPTEEEKEQCAEIVSQILPRKSILLSISGSSIHKKWIFVLDGIKKLLDLRDDIVIITVGDDHWIPEIRDFKHPRHFHKSGDDGWNIRHSLTFAKCGADLVFGPETGLLLSVAFDANVKKIMWLSHSSPNNHFGWINTRFITPKPDQVPCWPCHTLHDGLGTCELKEYNHSFSSRWPLCCFYLDVNRFLDIVCKCLDTN